MEDNLNKKDIGNIISISINNFRIFSKEQKIDLHPLTIIAGRNNSGKSAVAKALELFKCSYTGNLFNDIKIEKILNRNIVEVEDYIEQNKESISDIDAEHLRENAKLLDKLNDDKKKIDVWELLNRQLLFENNYNLDYVFEYEFESMYFQAKMVYGVYEESSTNFLLKEISISRKKKPEDEYKNVFTFTKSKGEKHIHNELRKLSLYDYKGYLNRQMLGKIQFNEQFIKEEVYNNGELDILNNNYIYGLLRNFEESILSIQDYQNLLESEPELLEQLTSIANACKPDSLLNLFSKDIRNIMTGKIDTIDYSPDIEMMEFENEFRDYFNDIDIQSLCYRSEKYFDDDDLGLSVLPYLQFCYEEVLEIKYYYENILKFGFLLLKRSLDEFFENTLYMDKNKNISLPEENLKQKYGQSSIDISLLFLANGMNNKYLDIFGLETPQMVIDNDTLNFKFQEDKEKANPKKQYWNQFQKVKSYYAIQELGSGKQQLYYLISGIVNSNSKTIFVEEPEVNLHPDWQSALADFFVFAHKEKGIRFIIETHSEYLIRRLQVLVAENGIEKEKIGIYNFHKQENKDLSVQYISILDNGKLSGDLNSGFFDEASKSISKLWDLQFEDS